jgi:hypothetical protein
MATPSAEGVVFFTRTLMSLRATLSGYFCSRDRGWMLSLLAAVGLLYAPFLGSPFVFDDLPFLMGGTAGQYAHGGFHFELRWLPYASLGWTARLFSEVAPHFFHLGNLLLHAANVILLFYLLRRLMAAAMPGSNPSAAVWGAWFGALAFALHPVAVYAAGYVIERSILMATTFALAMQLAWLRGLLTGQARWLALTVIFYFLAVFSKEHSVMMPLVLAAEAVLLRGRIQATRPALWAAAGGFAAVGTLVALIAKGVVGAPYEAMAAALFEQQGVVAAGNPAVLHLLSGLTQAGLLFKYLLLWVLPNPAWMSVDMREPFISSPTAWQGWLGAAAFIVYGALGVRLLLRGGAAGLAGLALLYPWLQFLLEFSSIRVQETFVLYRSYLWMPGLMLLIPLLLAQWPGRKTAFALGAAVLLLVPLAANRLWIFADNYRLWNDAALLLSDARAAGADRIFFNRGQAEAAAYQWDAAIVDFRRAVTLSPQYPQVHYELGMAYVNAKRYQEAAEQFDAEIGLNADDGNAYFGKGLALMGLLQAEQASIQLQKGCRLGVWVACLVSGNPKHKK